MIKVIKLSTGKEVEFTNEAWAAIQGTTREKNYRAKQAANKPLPELKELNEVNTPVEENKPLNRKSGKNKTEKE